MPADFQPPGALNHSRLAAPAVSGPRAAILVALGQLFALSLAVLGGGLGIIGAAVQELRTGGFLLLPFLGAPIIEELMKPVGVYILLIRWPSLLRGRLHTAFLTALAGLSFGVIEAVVYVTLYVPDHSQAFFIYRFTLPLFVHALASFIVGLGINRGLLDWASKGAPLARATRNFYIAGISLHAVFNITVTALYLAGVLDV